MTSKTPFTLPMVDFYGHGANSKYARFAYDPWALQNEGGVLTAGHAPLPDSFTVDEILWSLQSPWTIPAGFNGRVAFAVDPRGDYCRKTGFPKSVNGEPFEDGHPAGDAPAFASVLDLRGGNLAFAAIRPLDCGPITVQRGDKFILVTETDDGAPGTRFMVFCSPRLGYGGGRLPKLPGLVYDVPHNGTAPGDAPPSFRCAFPPIKGSGAKTKIRVHVASRGNGLAVARIGVGKQSGSGSDMTAAPVPITFNAGEPYSLPVDKSGWSDEIDFATNDGDALIFNIAISGGWAFKGYAPEGCRTWHSDAASHGHAAMQGTVTEQVNPARVHVIDAVQVL